VTTKKKKPGPEAETLQIPGNWKDAVKVALKRGKPPKKAVKKKGRKR
jgi:hypothetical protein